MIRFEVHAKSLPKSLSQFITGKADISKGEEELYCFTLTVLPDPIWLKFGSVFDRKVGLSPELLIARSFQIADYLVLLPIRECGVLQLFLVNDGDIYYRGSGFDFSDRLIDTRFDPDFESYWIWTSLEEFHRDAASFLKDSNS